VTAPGEAQEPPASVLMRAAKKMREDAEACGDPPGSFIPEVAAWLEIEAACLERKLPGDDGTWRCALRIALAYLGENETEGALS
jgi:hypothetical protein